MLAKMMARTWPMHMSGASCVSRWFLNPIQIFCCKHLLRLTHSPSPASGVSAIGLLPWVAAIGVVLRVCRMWFNYGAHWSQETCFAVFRSAYSIVYRWRLDDGDRLADGRIDSLLSLLKHPLFDINSVRQTRSVNCSIDNGMQLDDFQLFRGQDGTLVYMRSVQHLFEKHVSQF